MNKNSILNDIINRLFYNSEHDIINKLNILAKKITKEPYINIIYNGKEYHNYTSLNYPIPSIKLPIKHIPELKGIIDIQDKLNKDKDIIKQYIRSALNLVDYGDEVYEILPEKLITFINNETSPNYGYKVLRPYSYPDNTKAFMAFKNKNHKAKKLIDKYIFINKMLGE